MTERRVQTKTELFIDGAWTDISAYVAMGSSDQIQITRGRQNEGTSVEASTCTLKLNNKDGRFTPRNPMSPYYGKIGRNTPLRVAAAAPLLSTTFDTMPAWLDANFGGASVSGGQAVLPCISAYSGLQTLAGYNLIGSSLSLQVVTNPGTSGTREFVVSLDLDANNRVLMFDSGGTFTGRLRQGGVNTDVSLGTYSPTAHAWWRIRESAGLIYFEASPDGVSWSTLASHTYTLATTSLQVQISCGYYGTETSPPSAVVDNLSIGVPISVRFTGEVSAWPQKWNDTGYDVWTQVQASGILRRLGQGQGLTPNTTRLKDWILGQSYSMYWPLDDKPPTTVGRSYPPNHSFISVGPGVAVTWGAGDLGDAIPPGLLIKTTGTSGGSVQGDLSILSDATAIATDFVFKSTALGPLMLSQIEYPSGGGGLDYRVWQVLLRADGTNNDIAVTTVDNFDSIGVVFTQTQGVSPAQPALTDGLVHHFRFKISASGSAVAFEVDIDGIQVLTGSVASSTMDGAADVQLTYAPTADNGPVAVGHLAVYQDANIPSVSLAAQLVDGYVGEAAGRRIERLCQDNSIPFTSVGDLDATVLMGAQSSTGDFISLLQDAANADMGVLYEPRDQVGLAYRTRTSIYNQAADVTLDYSAGVLGTAPDVTDDDQNVHNDMTVSRSGGASAEDVLTSGALSTQPPPNGIGVYASSVSVNVLADALLADQASWRLALGTIDEARYPSLQISMVNPAVSGNPTLLAALLACDIVDRLLVTHLPAWLPPDDVNLLAQGYTETLQLDAWDIAFNCTPESPYHVAVYGSAAGSGPDRYDAENSTLNSSATTTATSLSVASAPNTQPWTTAVAEFPFDVTIAGERMTVTNITGASSPQTFTVTRSVNGVVKAHSAGETVRLWKTPRYAL